MVLKHWRIVVTNRRWECLCARVQLTKLLFPLSSSHTNWGAFTLQRVINYSHRIHHNPIMWNSITCRSKSASFRSFFNVSIWAGTARRIQPRGKSHLRDSEHNTGVLKLLWETEEKTLPSQIERPGMEMCCCSYSSLTSLVRYCGSNTITYSKMLN